MERCQHVDVTQVDREAILRVIIIIIIVIIIVIVILIIIIIIVIIIIICRLVLVGTRKLAHNGVVWRALALCGHSLPLQIYIYIPVLQHCSENTSIHLNFLRAKS